MAAAVRNVLYREGRYYARMVVPRVLRRIVGKTEFRAPLGADKRKAFEKSYAVLAGFRAKIEAARRQLEVKSRPRRRLMTDVELAHLHYKEELSIDDQLRDMPVDMSEEIVVGFGATRETVPARPMAVRKQNAFVSDALLKVLRRIASGEAMDNEMAAVVGWVIDDYQARGLIAAELGETDRRSLSRMFAKVEIDAWKRREERDRGEPDGAPSLALLKQAVPDDLDADPVSLHMLLSDYMAELQRSGRGTEAARKWKSHFDKLTDFLGHDDARRLTRKDVIRWKDKLYETLSAKTIGDGYIAALKAALRWGVDNSRLAENVAADVRVAVPKKVMNRERGFTDDEAKAILEKVNAYKPMIRKSATNTEARHTTAAKRWVPFLCAFTGARVAEMTQLRGCDVFLDVPIPYLRIKPDAGSVKNREFRDVPLHAQLVELGFGDFVRASGDGPLFYDGTSKRNGRTHPAKQVADELAKWVRGLGVAPPDVAPNHGWRHRFKTVALRRGVEARVADAIQGHAPRTAGENYGDVTLETMKRAIDAFEAYDLRDAPADEGGF